MIDFLRDKEVLKGGYFETIFIKKHNLETEAEFTKRANIFAVNYSRLKDRKQMKLSKPTV